MKVGGTRPARSAGKKFLVVFLHFFGCKSTISRFGERFRDGQYSLVSFLVPVLLLAVLPCPAICKSGSHVPPCPVELALLSEGQKLHMELCTVSNKCTYHLHLGHFPFNTALTISTISRGGVKINVSCYMVKLDF